MEELKMCTKCGEVKCLSDFYRHKKSKNGIRASCKMCHQDQSDECRKLRPRKWKSNGWQKKYPSMAKGVRERYKLKRKKNPKLKLNDNISQAIWFALHGKKSGRHWGKLVGYTIAQLKKHLEKRFTQDMNWENYGTFWEVDHIIPQSVFNFLGAEDIDFKRCWSLKNLQPLEKSKNRRKSDKLEKPFQPSLAINC